MNQIIALIRKDITIEWRQRYALNGIVLHIVSSVFVVFLAVKTLNGPTWNALFWLIMLFTSVSAAAKGFIAESKGRSLYYYGISSAQQIIISKVIYNSLLMLLVAAVCFVVYSIVMGNEVQNLPLYLASMFAGSLGFSGIFTFVSSIASKAGNGSLIMPVLSFPVIIPLLLVLIRACKKAMDGIEGSFVWTDIFVLLFLDVIIIALAYILFPFLWKE